jgi:c-di-GMP-binding flagellar brake protein YcgR
MPVQLMDISLAGVLLTSPTALQPGETGRLSTRLGGRPIEVDVEVRRVARLDDSGHGFRIGARFVSIDDTTRQTMQQFLSNARA